MCGSVALEAKRLYVAGGGLLLGGGRGSPVLLREPVTAAMPQSLIERQSRLPQPQASIDTPSVEIGDQLKCMFDHLTDGPMPRRLLDLADALEEAFQRGELFDVKSCPRSGHAR